MPGRGQVAVMRGRTVATSAKELEVLFASASVGVGLLNRELRYERVNEALAQLNGLTVEEHTGRHVTEVVPEAIRARVQHSIRRVFDTGGAVLRQHLESPGRQVVVDYLPVRDDRGRLHCVAALVTELTEQRRAEEALALNLTLAQIVAEISTRFIDDDAAEADTSVGAALELIGGYLGLDRAAVWVFSPDPSRVVVGARWMSSRVTGEMVFPRSLDLSSAPWVHPRMMRGHEVVFDDVERLPAEAGAERVLFERFGMRAAAMFPLSVGRRVDGMVFFGKQEAIPMWPHETIGCLRVVAELIASALDRQRRERQERRRYRFQALLSRLATAFINTPGERLDEAINAALLETSRILDFDSAALYQTDAEGRLRATHRARTREDVPVACADGLTAEEVGWPMPLVLKGEDFVGGMDVLTADRTRFAAHYREHDLRQLACAPLVDARGVIGALAVSRYGRDGEIFPDLSAHVRLVTDLLAVMLARAEADAQRRRAFEELARLKSSIEGERDYLREEVDRSFGNGDILGNSPALEAALDIVDAVAPTTATVLLTGESGVGKELFARALHARSPRAEHALVKVNCAAIPRELFESEFFGHVRGAFTGATKDRVGRFELADGGTLFLDEVGEIPLELQSKLLRVLQESELERVGDDRTRRIDVRVIAATNRALELDVKAGRFRPDLFYRLSAFPIRIPSLRERREDVAPLAQHYLQAAVRATGRHGLSLDDQQLRQLTAYDWPGNVRELQHVIERAVILSRTPPLRIDLALASSAATQPQRPAAPTPPPPSPEEPARAQVLTATEMDAVERENLVQALTRSGWRVAGVGGAAELLGLAPSTLRDRMKVLGVVKPR